jgi:Flp pilus assembly protein TadD
MERLRPERVYRGLFIAGLALFGATLAAGLGRFVAREHRLPGLSRDPLAPARDAIASGDRAVAIAEFRRMAALGRWNVDSLLTSGEGLALAGRFEEAQALLDRAAALRAGDPRVHTSRGWTLLWSRQFRAAWNEFATAVQKDPNQARAYAGLGAVLLEQDRNAEARAVLLRAIEIDPGQAQPYNGVGITYALEGQPEEAARYFALAAAISPEPVFLANLERARAAAEHRSARDGPP